MQWRSARNENALFISFSGFLTMISNDGKKAAHQIMKMMKSIFVYYTDLFE